MQERIGGVEATGHGCGPLAIATHDVLAEWLGAFGNIQVCQ